MNVGGGAYKKEFVVGETTVIEDVLREIKKVFSLSDGQTRTLHEYYYDTFDWSLYAKGYLLKKWGRTFYLTTLEGRPVGKAPAISAKKFFSRELGDDRLRTILQPVTGVRALREILATTIRRSSSNVLNKDGKTVVRLSVDTGSARSEKEERPIVPVLRIEAMKGYEKPFSATLRICRDGGMEELPEPHSTFPRGLSAVGREVLDYSSAFTLALPVDVTISQAVGSICLFLVRAMEINYSGVVEDIDSEFLHDFRIAGRRTRSLLSQLKKYLPAEEVGFFQNEFRWLASLTGSVRDLDVYLLMREEYSVVLPDQLHSGLNDFFQDLEKRRKTQFQELRKGLTSTRYRSLMTGWKAFLQGSSSWGEEERQCRAIALRIMRKRYEKILKCGSKIVADSPDEELHRLRIHGKKLRYLLEFFRSFFDADDMDYFNKQFKKLQNFLGDFNDISVQMRMLEEYRKNLAGTSKRSIHIAAAVGGLIAHLAKRHLQARQKFADTFAEFASEKHKERFYGILS
jgi:CHAD domain-containing protein